MANRTILALSNEALAVIERRAPSPNKRGAWVSQALVEFDRNLESVDAAASGILERIEARLKRIEEQLAAKA